MGGLVGHLFNAHLTHSYSECDVVAKWDYAGGLVGDNTESVILGCWASGEVHAPISAGGLVGSHQDSSIYYSYAVGNVLIKNNQSGYTAHSVGGLVGGGEDINYCYSTAQVSDETGNASLGTFAGYSSLSSLTGCHAPDGQLIGYGGAVGDTLGMSFHITSKGVPSNVVKQGYADNVRTVVFGKSPSAPYKIEVVKCRFYGSKIWTDGDYPKINYQYFGEE